MSFLKNLGKKKLRFDFYINARYMLNLPTNLDGSSLLCQLKRKEKLSQTKYSLIQNSTVYWDEVLVISMSLFVEKSTHTDDAHFESKTATFCIKGFGDNHEKWKVDLDMAQFVKLHGSRETEHVIVMPTHKDSGPSPVLKLIIRAYCEGVDATDASDFSSVPNDMSYALGAGGYGMTRSNGTGEDDEDVTFTENPSHEHSVDIDERRKVSLMFSAATGNSSRAQPGVRARPLQATIAETEETADAEKRAFESRAAAELDKLEREAQAQHAAAVLMSMADTSSFLSNVMDDDVFGEPSHRDRLVSMEYGGRPWANDDLDGF